MSFLYASGARGDGCVIVSTTPAIGELIDKQDNYEIVRDQIAQIISNETAAQMILATAAGKDPELWDLRVYTERTNPWEAKLNNMQPVPPIINIWFESDNTDLKSSSVVGRKKMLGVFNIDCYGFGVSEEGAIGHLAGDENATRNSQRAATLVRNMVSSAQYTYLGIRQKVARRIVTSRKSLLVQEEKATVQHVAAMRLTLTVDFCEDAPQFLGEELEIIGVCIKRSEDGFILAEADYLTTP